MHSLIPPESVPGRSGPQAVLPARRSSRARLVAVVVAVVLLVLPALASVGAPSAGATPTSLESQMFTLLNQTRAQAGRAPLAWDEQLLPAARAWSAHLAATGVLSHDPNMVGEIAAVYPDWSRVGENVGYARDVLSMHNAFVASAPDYANMIGDYQRAVIAVVEAPPNLWVTVRFVKGGTPPPPPVALTPRQTGKLAAGAWYLRTTQTTGVADSSLGFGIPGDVPVIGDWNGDGIDGMGVFRNGAWYLRNSLTAGGADVAFSYGSPGDVPVIGDWNGDGIDTVGVFRNGVWYLRNSNTSGVADVAFSYGSPGDVPKAGKWQGGAKDTPGVFRGGVWYLRNSNTSGVADLTFAYGNPTDAPLVGDWNADGVTTPGVVRGNQWFLRSTNSTGVADQSFVFGDPGDLAAVARQVRAQGATLAKDTPVVTR